MRPPILALKEVRLADGPLMLFDGVDLALDARVRACLVGRNGTGKSTLMRILAGEIEPDEGERSVTPGTRVSRVPQEPEIEGATLLAYATAGGAKAHEAEAALTAFGVEPGKTTQGLSGGEIRRAALARAFAEDPDVLLLDEPTNHLDILAIATLEAMVLGSRAAVLIVSHDRAFLERVTGRCFWLEYRRVRRLDKGFAHYEAWAEKIEAAELEEARRLDRYIAREQHWMARGVTARRARNEGRRRRLDSLRQDKRDRLMEARGGNIAMGIASSGIAGRRVADVKAISKAFGDRVILKGFSTRILRGDRVAVVGPNGAGKTTLVKLLLGELAPDAGEVKLGTKLEISYIDQARAQLPEGATLRDVLLPLGGDQVMVRGEPRHVISYAKDFLFTENQLRQPVKSLSGGERNRLLLARALAKPANVMVLDEPTNDLDMETLDLLEDLLADYEGTLILVSHDRDFVDRLATSTIGLDGSGRAVETPGGWQDFVSQNPGFFRALPAAKPAPAKAASPSPPPKAAAAKLSYKDQRRLAELEGLVHDLPGKIAALEAQLADPGLYARDPAAFDRFSQALAAARAGLVAAEAEWMALEERREALVTR